uniref:PKD domain-containing protein n=1 Tax=Flavobacterium sp. TaxID=239 RepID=UPI00404B80AE
MKKKFEENIEDYKYYKLKVEFFSKFPEKKEIYYKKKDQNGVQQICNDGGFEGANPLNGYVFRTYNGNWQGGGFTFQNPADFTTVITTTPAFEEIPNASIGLNDFTAFATLVDDTAPGWVPNINMLDRVRTGTRAIKINSDSINFITDITTMSRNFIVNENTFNFHYSLVMENPIGHPNAQPFFMVRLYNTANPNVIIRQSVPNIANLNDCMFTDSGITSPLDGTPLLFSGWICDQIDTSDLIGQQITVEFVIADCGQGWHIGTVYIDDLCDTNCADPLFGSINLDQISTITCPTTTQTICGTFITPLDSILNSITLNVTQNNVVVGSIQTPTTLTGSTFCFDVPLNAFGINPNGIFEFQAVGNFTRICPQGNFTLLPITDNSANDTGPDVSILNCIEAVNDNLTLSSCNEGSLNILDNDTVYGNDATPANTIITIIGTINPNIQVNTNTGLVAVNAGLAPGVYTINYQICNENLPTHCDQGTITITIEQPQIEANDDDFSATTIISCIGGNTPAVISNDSFCGIAFTAANSNITLVNNGGISGATINNQGIISIPSNSNPGTYTLQYQICQMGTTVFCDTASVTIVLELRTPTFDFSTTICKGTSAPLLPILSNNGIIGTWNPAVIDNTATADYTFTPLGACASPVTITITILEECGLFLEWGSDVSCQLAEDVPDEKIDADIVDGPCIRVCENSTIEYALTGDVSSIDYTEWNITGGTFTATNTTCTITWDASASFSAIQANVHLTDGTVLLVNRCVEKLNAPIALFDVIPFNELTVITVCTNTIVNFNNLTTANNGHDDIYYNWDFGDGNTSNAFEPSHSYTSQGVYEVTLTAFNGCSCADRFSIRVIVEEGFAPIECPSVVCENDIATYAIPNEYGENCDLIWKIIGGTIVNHNANNTEIEVVWDQVDEDGFGYVTVSSDACFTCSTTVKVPVVLNRGTIKGVEVLCENTQGLYTLPQWPTTDFNWVLNDGGTGAILIQTNQRNEIVVQANVAGVLQLRCNYYNTLLGCSGNATFDILVTPSLSVVGDDIVCKDSTHTYNLLNNGGNVSSVNWQITGPNNFVQNGTSSPLSITFPTAGIYNLAVADPNYCLADLYQIQVLDVPQIPTDINGPLTVCPGVPVSYSCMVPNGTTPNWEVTNGTIIGNNTGSQIMVNFDPLATTPFEIKLSFLLDGCESDVLTTIIDRDMPSINFNVVEPLVCGSSYATYAIDPVDVDNYEWTIFPAAAGSIQAGQNTHEVDILWNQTPQTDVEVTVTVRKCGLEYTDTTLVEIVNAPAISITGPSQACTSSNITFSFTLGTGTSFTSVLWDFGDGTTETSTTSTSVVHAYNEPLTSSTTFTVTATVTGANGCLMPAFTSYQVEVSPSPVVYLSSPVNLNLCNPNNLPSDYTYSVNLQGGFALTSDYSVQWFKNGIFTGLTAATIDVSLPGFGVGTYYAVVTNVFLCSDTTTSFDVTDNCVTAGCASDDIDGTATNTGCNEITIDVTSFAGSPNEVYISLPAGLNQYITSLTPNQTIISGMEPGQYSCTLIAAYLNGCFNRKSLSFTIPYKAGIKHNVTCATTGGGYNVQILNYSAYFPGTPPTSFEFTTDGGATWQPGTPVGGIAQLTANLAPGPYTIGIKIQGGDFPDCTYFEELILPDYPIATFTHDSYACQNSAMQFYADDTTDGLQYLWEFPSDDSSNLQQDPVKSFSSQGSPFVSLTVTNKYGCSATHTQSVSVVSNNIDGKLELAPSSACEGSSAEIIYENIGIDNVETLYWYLNTYTTIPFAVTHEPNLELTVTQSGQYFVYAQNFDGCMEYGNIKPVSVAFVPAPEPPLVNGPTTMCLNNPINLSVPVNSNIEYAWTLNGDPMPTWQNLTEINFEPTALGSYVFTVAAQIPTGNGSFCYGLPTTHVVTVLETPETPVLTITQVQCKPYLVTVSVINPQGGVTYYWSNGDIGTSANITHDGPIQVRAEANGCSVTAQMDLPTDLDALAWIFPDGCFDICDVEDIDGYVIGPLGEFESWKWLENGSVVASGAGIIDPFAALTLSNDYQLYLATEFCDALYENASFSNQICADCNIDFTFKKPKCLNFNGYDYYQVTLTFVNNMGVPVTVTVTAPNGEGIFTTSTFILPVGSSSFPTDFNPSNGFTGGTVSFVVEGTSVQGSCLSDFNITFPNCNPLPRMNNSNENSFMVVPNPAKDFTTVSYELQDTGAVTIEIDDAFGRIIWTKTLDASSGKVVLDCSGYAAGYYPVVLKQNGVVVAHAKLIVQ